VKHACYQRLVGQTLFKRPYLIPIKSGVGKQILTRFSFRDVADAAALNLANWSFEEDVDLGTLLISIQNILFKRIKFFHLVRHYRIIRLITICHLANAYTLLNLSRVIAMIVFYCSPNEKRPSEFSWPLGC
jgi:hypothetical protein